MFIYNYFMSVSQNVIELKNVIRRFGTQSNPIYTFGPIDLEIPKGSFTLILGRSGSGKSTLLNLISGLDKITSGSLKAHDKELSKVGANHLAKYRSSNGIIFQSYHLLPNLNTYENVMVGGLAGGKNIDKKDIESALERVGMSHRKNTNVKTLSGGEKQRVAIARVLATNPEILFCDEPTGALDSQNELEVMNLLKDLHNQGQTIVVVSHNADFEKLATKIIKMQDGKIIEIINK
jgi:putative ABC transport system ATP-binding protein